MDSFKKSQTFCFDASADNTEDYSVNKPGLYQSQSFAYGYNTDTSFNDFSEFKSSLNQVSYQEPIKEEPIKEETTENKYDYGQRQDEITQSQKDDEELRKYADQMKDQYVTSNTGKEYQFD